MTLKNQIVEEIGRCSPCSARQEGNTRLCWLCGRTKFMSEKIWPREYLRFMSKRGEELI